MSTPMDPLLQPLGRPKAPADWRDPYANARAAMRMQRETAMAGVRIDYFSADEAWRLALRMLKIPNLPQASYVYFERAVDLFADRREAALRKLRR